MELSPDDSLIFINRSMSTFEHYRENSTDMFPGQIAVDSDRGQRHYQSFRTDQQSSDQYRPYAL